MTIITYKSNTPKEKNTLQYCKIMGFEKVCWRACRDFRISMRKALKIVNQFLGPKNLSIFEEFE
ncbi:MAG: hypothetical protein DRO96_03345 [Candidatus Aenigmatarchaeota archaeon]|nr:MAG: hypothetical protein DRO96_03345 [Candidatus Aenigmarchaeota archaeon]